ncbi:MAG: hypothetical protein EPO32_04725 [Anaerolineae bacterium]|nr:MAG: hypothetical protein EPO32_04725 [Anaerolineae bacterium]
MPAHQPPAFPPNAGLCRACRHAHLIESARGSVFLLCQAAKEFSLPKYPHLPVVACIAFQPQTPPPDTVE